jgi:hypothetical protein
VRGLTSAQQIAVASPVLCTTPVIHRLDFRPPASLSTMGTQALIHPTVDDRVRRHLRMPEEV